MTKPNNKENKNVASGRSVSRLVAVQSFYQYNFYQGRVEIKDLADQLLDDYLADENDKKIFSYNSKVDHNFLDKLVLGAKDVLDELDKEIEKFLKENWKIEQVSDVMREILRLGTYELKFMKEIPAKVVINEYVDLAACFYHTKKVTFVNSVLQNISNNNRENF
jgi:N utilization substance protein B